MLIKDKNLYYVGGFVRDEILGIKNFDIDYCYEGDAISFAKEFNVIKTNPDFGTVRVVIDNNEIDIASTRTEVYPNSGHLPVVEKIGCSLREDLRRRDFTINALAKNTVTGEIKDYFNGLSDIENKKLRVLHDKSFIDDPTRIIRGLKFSVRLGFKLDELTKKLQEEYLENINYDISYHRLKKELKETFNLNKKEAYDIFIEQNIYKLLGKEQSVVKINNSIDKLISQIKPEHVWLVYLGEFNLSNFELTSEEKDIINNFDNIKHFSPQNDIEIYKLFADKPIEALLLYANFVNFEIVEHYFNNLAGVKLEVTGDSLLELGIPSGKVYKEIFEYLIEEKIKNPSLTKADELTLVKKRFLND